MLPTPAPVPLMEQEAFLSSDLCFPLRVTLLFKSSLLSKLCFLNNVKRGKEKKKNLPKSLFWRGKSLGINKYISGNL